MRGEWKRKITSFVVNFAVFYLLFAFALLLWGVFSHGGTAVATFGALFAALWYSSIFPGRFAFNVDQHWARWFGDKAGKFAPLGHAAKAQNEAESPKAVAERALHRAGLDQRQLAVHLNDVGLLVYCGGQHPEAIARDESIRSDATHVRPFMRLNFPLQQNGGDTIRFELLDAQGQVRYSDESWYDLMPGDNFLTTKTWLPLHDEIPDGHWTLRVVVGETPFAVHLLRWHKRHLSGLRARLQSDGEIDDQVRVAAAQPLSKPLSLDELLSDQQPVAHTTIRRQ